MSIKPKSHIEITIESMKVFLNDGQLDVAELNFLLGIALRDGGINEDERRVLRICGRVVLGSLSVFERLPGERAGQARRRRRGEQKALAQRSPRALRRAPCRTSTSTSSTRTYKTGTRCASSSRSR